MAVPRVLPGEDERTGWFWQAAARGELAIQRCANCGTYAHPPRQVCRHCHSSGEALQPATVSGRGTVGSWVVVQRPFLDAQRDDGPYVLVAVDLVDAPGVRLPAMLADADGAADLRLGDPVEAVFVEAGGVAVPQFRRTVRP